MTHANKHNILYNLQFGFRENRSCETQLLGFVYLRKSYGYAPESRGWGTAALLAAFEAERAYLETEAKIKFLLTYSLDHTKIDPHAMIFTIHHLHFQFKGFQYIF